MYDIIVDTVYSTYLSANKLYDLPNVLRTAHRAKSEHKTISFT